MICFPCQKISREYISKHLQLIQSGSMMAAAAVDVNQKIISTNLDIMEEQRGQMHHAVDQYVDKVKVAGRQWITKGNRNRSTFLEIHKITSNAMLFLSLKCDEMKSEFASETSDLIERGEFTQQKENAQMDSPSTSATTHGKSKEDLSTKVDQITTDLTEKVDQVNKDLSARVAQITTNLSTRVHKISAQLSNKVNETNLHLSAKVDQINGVLQSLQHSEKEHAVQINKITDLEKQFNTIEKDTQNNDKQVQQELDEVWTNICAVKQKVTVLSREFLKYAKMSDLEAVGFSAESNAPSGYKALSVVGNFEFPTFCKGCKFDPDTGICTASSEGTYLVYVSVCLCKDGHSGVSLIHEYTEFDQHEDEYFKLETKIYSIEADRKCSTECKLNIITMDVDDKLFIRTSVYSFDNCKIQFLCLRIG